VRVLVANLKRVRVRGRERYYNKKNDVEKKRRHKRHQRSVVGTWLLTIFMFFFVTVLSNHLISSKHAEYGVGVGGVGEDGKPEEPPDCSSHHKEPNN